MKLRHLVRILHALRRVSAKLDAWFAPTELPTFVEKLFLW